MIVIKNADIIAPRGIKRGNVIIEKGKIASIKKTGSMVFPGTTIDAKGAFVSAGFIDLHIHGDVAKIAKTQIKFGTTSFLKTIYESSPQALKAELYAIEKMNTDKDGAIALGLNMEGPFINKNMRGALLEKYIKTPSAKLAQEIIKRCKRQLKIMTIAPELRASPGIIKLLKRNNISASIGHTDADFAKAKKAIALGAGYATHVFNRMRGMAQREPGALGAILDDERIVAEIILDGIHVHPACFRILLKSKGSDKIVLATDSVACGPIPGSTRCGKFFITRDGTYAGSALTMNKAVKNAIAFGNLDICEAVKMATINPAKVLKIDKKKGSIEKGKDADIIIFDKDLNIKTAIVNGKIVFNRLK